VRLSQLWRRERAGRSARG